MAFDTPAPPSTHNLLDLVDLSLGDLLRRRGELIRRTSDICQEIHRLQDAADEVEVELVFVDAAIALTRRRHSTANG